MRPIRSRRHFWPPPIHNPSAIIARGPTGRRDINIAAPDCITIELGKLHPRPEALVAEVLNDAAAAGGFQSVGAYRPTPLTEDYGARQFVLIDKEQAVAGRPVEIIERSYLDEDAAVAALKAGEVDMLDRVAPWHVASLRAAREIELVRYAPLSVHALCVCSDHPLLLRAESRRAPIYAIDREAILKNHLKVADSVDGSQPARGVLSRGRSPEDPLGYADDPSLAARPYDLQAAYILSRLAGGGGLVTTGMPPLVLAYPKSLVAAKACEQIRRHWARIGINVELRPVAEPRPNLQGVDLFYSIIVAPEPLVAVDRLFGPSGLVPKARREVLAPLRQLAGATTFAAARTALFELQRTVHEQSLVLPLWQLNEYAAKRRRVTVGQACADVVVPVRRPMASRPRSEHTHSMIAAASTIRRLPQRLRIAAVAAAASLSLVATAAAEDVVGPWAPYHVNLVVASDGSPQITALCVADVSRQLIRSLRTMAGAAWNVELLDAAGLPKAHAPLMRHEAPKVEADATSASARAGKTVIVLLGHDGRTFRAGARMGRRL
ncbi:MAG: ABC transporter substrate-binding protein [Pirellulales bacterium]